MWQIAVSYAMFGGEGDGNGPDGIEEEDVFPQHPRKIQIHFQKKGMH